MKKLIVVALLTASIAPFSAWSQCPTSYSYQTSGNNNTFTTETWSASGGSVSPGGTPPLASWAQNPFHWSYNNTDYANSIVIPSGVVLDIEDNSFDISPYTNLIVQGTLVANGKVNVPAGGNIIIDTGGKVCCNGSCNASDRITVGGTTVWGGSTGNFNPVPGPASSNGSGALPIVLAWFNAKVQSSSIALNWSTLSEVNFDYFSLQRSSDGKSFAEIAQIKGSGTSNEAHSYSYEDTDPIIGRSYYRLTSNDFDGYQETFKVVSVEYHGGKKFHVSPNPSDGSSVKLNFNFENEADAQVTIFDNVGSQLGTYRVSGSGSINFENTLKSGVYLAKYTSSSFTKTERFLVK